MRLLSLLSFFLVACGSGDPAAADGASPSTEGAAYEVEGPILATVGGVPITVAEFQAAAAREMPRDGSELGEEERRAILDELVTEKLLYLEAHKRGIHRDSKVQRIMVNTLLRQDVYANVRNSDFTPEELRAYFEEHKEEFVTPEKVQVRRIFVRGEPARSDEEARALAEDLHGQALADPDRFRDLATAHSEDPYRRRGGDLGFVERAGKPGVEDTVVEAAFALDVGEISAPFEGGGGWNVVTVTNRRDRVERTFEQMKGSVLRKVKNDRYRELYTQYVDEIRPGYAVEIDEASLQEATVAPGRRMSVGSRLPSRFPGPGDDHPEGD